MKRKFHDSFDDWIACISDLAMAEKEAQRPHGHNSWMAGPVRELREFQISAGLVPLRKIWDDLPRFKAAGMAAIEEFLRDCLSRMMHQDNSAIIAAAIWSCLLLHGEAVESASSGPAEPEESKPQDEISVSEPLAAKPYPSVVGSNIDRLRKECGLSFDDLAAATEIDKKLILGHVNAGTSPYPRTLSKYALVFTKKLGRRVTVAELEGSAG
jgi:hypothetical protein